MGLPAGAAAALERFLDAADAAAPGLVVGLHAVGSLALGDYHPDRSDIDVVVAVSGPPDASQRSLLAEVHRVVATRIDGPYVPESAFARRPDDVGPVAFHVYGRFQFGPCHEVSPVTWSILAADAVTIRGIAPAALGLRADDAAVRAFSAANLRGYWTGWAGTIGTLIAETDGDDAIEANMLEWGVLGVSRVHCAAMTGRVVSKRDAGDYARDAFGAEWHPIIDLAIAARERTADTIHVADLRRACDFVASVAQ